MLYCDRIDLSEGVDPAKSNNSKESIICHNSLFNHEFKFQHSICNGCHDLTIVSVNISNIAIITLKGVAYRCVIHDISKFEAVCWKILYLVIVGIYKMHIKEIKIKSRVFNNLIKSKNLKTRNILIDKKNYDDLVIYFIRYDGRKSIRILSPYYNKLIGTIEEHERKITW